MNLVFVVQEKNTKSAVVLYRTKIKNAKIISPRIEEPIKILLVSKFD
jgi:hypothetical protein